MVFDQNSNNPNRHARRRPALQRLNRQPESSPKSEWFQEPPVFDNPFYVGSQLQSMGW
jgi:hypothetical protein